MNIMSENGEGKDIEKELKEEEEILDEAKELVEHASSLVESKYYDDAIEILRKALSLYQQIGYVDEIQEINQKIDEIYILKEKEFREVDIQEIRIPDELVISYLDKEEIIEKHVEDSSYTAEELVEEAKKLIEIDEYDEAIEKYDDAIKLYKKTNEDAEIEEIYKLIDECYDAKAGFLKQPKDGIEAEDTETILPDESIKTRKEEEAGEKLQRVADVERRKAEEEDFQKRIDDMVNEAEKKTRRYEYDIRKGNFDLDPPYSNAIKIYEEVRDMLKDYGWNDQIPIYTRQIKLTKQKLENDKKLREIEVQKREKDKVYQESLKVKRIEGADIDKARTSEVKRKEDEVFQVKIDEMVTKVDISIREYERAIREGNFDLDPPYSNAIKIYEEVRDKLKDYGWNDQIPIYTNQIKVMRQKLEKDKKLREIEAQKMEKDKLYQESLKIKKAEGATIDKARIYEEKRKEDELFQRQIDEMINEAEKKVRRYEYDIRKGDFEKKCPYPEVIETYEEVKKLLIKKNWKKESIIYTNQIKLYQEKLVKDKKLREIETQKREKDRAYKESFKVKRVEVADIDKARAIEEKQKEVEAFQTKIDEMVTKVDISIREYERAIREGNFDLTPPYNSAIKTYEEVRDILKNYGWKDQVVLYTNQIKFMRQKLDTDKKLREIEMSKVQKQKQYEESLKVKKEDIKLKADIEHLKDIEDRYKKELEEEEFENQITALVDKADGKVRKYELTIRYGQFEQECVYPEVIEIYEEIRKRLQVKGWKKEAMIYNNQIKLYQDKLEQDKKLREVEAQKREKDLAYLEALKARKEAGIDIEKLKKLEEKAKDDGFFQIEIDKLATQAEKSLKNYELAIRRGNFEAEPPFNEVINIYSDVRDMLQEKGWNDQANIYLNQINLIKQKQVKDKKLREIESRKMQQQKEFEEQFKIKTTEPTINLQKLKELKLKKEDKELLINEAFRLIDEAEKLVKNYEYIIKTDILHTESPYDGIISLYKAARKIFLENKWEMEASRLINTIKYYKERKEKDEKLRGIEAEKLARDKIPLIAPEIKPKKTLLEREQIILELEKEKQEKEDLASNTFNLIDEAERLAKNYEFKLKEGVFLDCPYEQIIKIYRTAKKQFGEIGWEDQSLKLISTINYYKEKLEQDNKLRELEKEKIEKQKREMESKRRLAEKDRKHKAALRKEKEEALLLKSKEISPFETQKDHAFRLMDQAKYQFNLNNFDIAIKLYRESENIFSEIKWAAGITMIRDSIDLIRKKQQEYKYRQKAIKVKKEDALKSVKEIEDRAAKEEDISKLQQEQKRREMLLISEQKQKEKESSDRAFDLLEQGTMLLKRKKFDEAHNKYITARDIFKQIGWLHEVSRINNELLLNLRKEEKESKRLAEYKLKKKEERKEMEILLQEAEKQKKELEKMKVHEKREKLLKIQVADQLKGKIKDKIKDANIDIIKFKYNEGIIKFRDAMKMMEKLDWKSEIAEIEKQIYVLKNKTLVPLITLEEFDKEENKDRVQLAYEALDNAQMSLLKNRFMRAISELNEAAFNLKDTKIGKNFIEEIENKSKNYREDLDKKKPIITTVQEEEVKEFEEPSADLAQKFMEKCKRAEKRLRFDKAIEFALEAKVIFSKLGSEWLKEQNTIEKYVDTLKRKKEERLKAFDLRKEEIEKKEVAIKKEEDEFKSRITARREARRKRIEELMEKK